VSLEDDVAQLITLATITVAFISMYNGDVCDTGTISIVAWIGNGKVSWEACDDHRGTTKILCETIWSEIEQKANDMWYDDLEMAFFAI